MRSLTIRSVTHPNSCDVRLQAGTHRRNPGIQHLGTHRASRRIYGPPHPAGGDAVATMIPTRGYGMNTGLGDAFNLGWKLLPSCRDGAGQRLAGSYEAERRPGR